MKEYNQKIHLLLLQLLLCTPSLARSESYITVQSKKVEEFIFLLLITTFFFAYNELLFLLCFIVNESIFLALNYQIAEIWTRGIHWYFSTVINIIMCEFPFYLARGTSETQKLLLFYMICFVIDWLTFINFYDHVFK